MIEQNQKSREYTKRVISSCFGRKISNIEADSILEKMESETKKASYEIKDKTGKISKSMFGNFDLSKRIFFSPSAAIQQVGQSILAVGEEEFEKNRKYKKAKEILVAIDFIIARKKTNKENWVISGQETPDIILADPFKNKRIKLEIMEIPNRIKEGWSSDISSEVASFILKKKNSKDYGKFSHLLVHFRFNKMKLNVEEICNRMNDYAKNNKILFEQIWAIAYTKPDSSQFKIFCLYPYYFQESISKDEKLQLLY